MNKQLIEVKRMFNDWARSERASKMAHGHNEIVIPPLSKININAETTFLDIGCGIGKAIKTAEGLGVKKFYGIDISEEMIKAAKKNLGKNAILKTGSATNLPWKEEYFTDILSIEALYYLSDPTLALYEIYRVLAYNGTFSMVIEFYEENKGTHAWQSCLPIKLTLWSESEWIIAIKNAGFNVIESKRIKRQDYKTKEEFVTNDYYPSYELYMDYIENGALWIYAEKNNN